MGLFPNFDDWLKKKGFNRDLMEGKKKLPDYSFDQWMKNAEELGDEMDSSVEKAKGKEKELDSEKKKPDSEKKPTPKDTENDDKSADNHPQEEEKEKWNQKHGLEKEEPEQDS